MTSHAFRFPKSLICPFRPHDGSFYILRLCIQHRGYMNYYFCMNAVRSRSKINSASFLVNKINLPSQIYYATKTGSEQISNRKCKNRYLLNKIYNLNFTIYQGSSKKTFKQECKNIVSILAPL